MLSRLALALTLAATAVGAQDWTRIDGDETCRPIWREYGRHMSGRAYAVHCEIREVGTIPARNLIEVEGEEHSGVTIVGGQRRDIRVRLVIQTQGETVEDARAIARQVTLDPNSNLLRADVPEFRESRRNGRRFASAMILLDTPIETNITASVMHSALSVENVRGRINVSAEHGPLDMRDVGGDVRARSRHGPLSVYVSTSQWQGAGLDAHSAHGPLTLTVPREFNAQLEIGADHGPLDIDFPITVTRFDRSRIETRLGSGGPPVRAHAEHGPMALRIGR